jgi:perosamine synthetase
MNGKEKLNEIFKKAVAEYLGIENVFLFWKGRVALYAILKAIDIKEGDEIILPAFTCVVVANPIIYLGAKPVYIDIDPLTLNIDPKKIEEKITKKTKVIIAQNTFGLSSDLDAIFEIAKKYNLFVIEDCAHGFGGTYKGKKNGTISDASFFSSQWNKPFSTGIGGIAVTKNEIIAQKLKEIEAKAVKPNLKEKIMLETLVEIKKRFLKPKIYWFALNTYRKLSQLNLVVGSSQGYEIEKPVEPENFLKGFSDFQAKEGLKYFEKVNGKLRIDNIIEHRKKIANLYKQMLLELNLEPPYEPSYAEHTYLKFPLFVKNRAEFFALAEKEKIELGDWFISPIHPIINNFELWYYNFGENPIAEFASKHIVNLPTHEDNDEKYLEKIYNFLKKNKDLILGSNLDSILKR